MKKKRKKDKEAEEIIELEQEFIDDDSINQFEKEDKDAICRYIG